jgi:CheY-like chemotaxis protein
MGTVFFIELPLFDKKTASERFSESQNHTVDTNFSFEKMRMKLSQFFFRSIPSKVAVTDEDTQHYDINGIYHVSDNSSGYSLNVPDIESFSSGPSLISNILTSNNSFKRITSIVTRDAFTEEHADIFNSLDEFATTVRKKTWESELNVLIVDDSLINRKMASNVLKSMGHKVDQAVDGIDFLRSLNIVLDNGTRINTGNSYVLGAPFPKYDFILIDENMPSMSGPEATKIARDLGYSGLIFGLTGNADDDDRRRFVAHGVNGVFLKPLNIDILKTVINQELALV